MSDQQARQQDRSAARPAQEDSSDTTATVLPSAWAPAVAALLAAEPDHAAADPAGGQALDERTEGVLRRRQGRGAPLPENVANEMGSALGADLNGVRVHDDGEAAEVADRLGAQAFTAGQDIYFGAGQYQPGTANGRHVLAHEVAHTIQQRSSGLPPGRMRLGRNDDPAEHHADQLAARALGRGEAAGASTLDPSFASVRRLVDPKKFDWDSMEFGTTQGTAKRHLLRLIRQYGALAGVPAGDDTATAILDKHAKEGGVVPKALELLAEMVGTIEKWIKDHSVEDPDAPGTELKDGTRKRRRAAFDDLKGRVQAEDKKIVDGFVSRVASLPDREDTAEEELDEAIADLASVRGANDDAASEAAPYEAALERARRRLEQARETEQARASALKQADKALKAATKKAGKAPEQLAAAQAKLAELQSAYDALSPEKRASRAKSHAKRRKALLAKIAKLQKKTDDLAARQNERQQAATSHQLAQDATVAAEGNEQVKAGALDPYAERKQQAEEALAKAEAAKQEKDDQVKALATERTNAAGVDLTGHQLTGAFSTEKGKAAEKHYDDKADERNIGKSSFERLGGIIDGLVSKDGDQAHLNVTVDIPVEPSGSGVVGLGLSLAVSKDDGIVKIRGELSVRAGAQFALAGKLMGAVGAFMESAGADGGEAATLLSYAMYRRFRESNAVPSEVSNRAWGGDWGKFGYVRADAWSRAVETRIIGNPPAPPTKPGPNATHEEKLAHRMKMKKWRLDNAKKYVVSGGFAALEGEIGPDLGNNRSIGAAASLKGTVGSRIDAISLQDKGGAGEKNRKSTGLFAQLASKLGGPERGAERSVARLHTGVEAKAKVSFSQGFPPFGSVGIEAEGVGTMEWLSTGHRSTKTGGKNADYDRELTNGVLEISGTIKTPSAPGVSMLVEEVTTLATTKIIDKLPDYWEKADVKPSVIKNAVDETTTSGKFREVVGGLLGSTSVGAQLKNVNSRFTGIGDTSGYSAGADQGHMLKMTIEIDWVGRETSISFSRVNELLSLSLPGYISAAAGSSKRIAKITHPWKD